MRMVIDGKPYPQYNSTKAVEIFYNKKIGRKLTQNKINLATRAPWRFKSKKSEKYQSVQKSLFQLANN